MRSKAIARRSVVRIADGRLGPPGDDLVAVEEPLEIRVDGDTVAVTMRTPGDDGALAVGFLFSEGVVRSRAQIGSVVSCGRLGDEGSGNVVDVRSGPGYVLDPVGVLDARRTAPTSSACGVCGRRSVADLVARAGRVETDLVVEAEVVAGAVERLGQHQPAFRATGGVHGAVAFTRGGDRVAAYEDVGRHNAVDKVVGALLLGGRLDERASERPALLVVSGRAGFEIVQKAAAAAIPVVASVSAATSLAIDLAETAGVTLLSFVRGGGANVHTHPMRIVHGPAWTAA